MIKFTTILWHVADKLNISAMEYVICDTIYQLSTNPNSTYFGWCYMSRKNMADRYGMSTRGLQKIVSRLEDKGLVFRDLETNYLKPTSLWCETYQGVNKVQGGGEQSSYPHEQSSDGGGEQSSYNNKNINIDNNNTSNNTGDFDFFWDQYHKITSMPKTDKEPALKHWKKLTETERNLAIEKITDYYHSVENKKYVKKARTYLADKSFNDEHVNAEKKEEQYPDAVKMLAALGGYGPSIYPAIVKRLHEVQYESKYGFDGILKIAVMAVENFIERGVNAYTWKAIESIDDPELRRDFRNRVKSHGYEAIHQRMVKKYLNEPAGKI